MFDAREILDIAIRIEKNGETIYRRAMQQTSNPDLILVLEWMADEESRHAKWFERLKAEIEASARNPFAEEMGQKVLEDLIGEKGFSLEDVDFSQSLERIGNR